ncbi:MAG: hypothetical protein JXA09_10390 [Anaerolineae bacterium]|nr:hypothetical protein [Anaerolineae bacterium]
MADTPDPVAALQFRLGASKGQLVEGKPGGEQAPETEEGEPDEQSCQITNMVNLTL